MVSPGEANDNLILLMRFLNRED